MSPRANPAGGYGGYQQSQPGTAAAGQTFNPAAAQAPNFYGQIGNLLTQGGWNPQGSILGEAAGAAAPQIAAGQLQESQALAQAGLVGPAMQLGEAQLQSSTGYDIANALLSEQGLGLQEQGLAQQIGTAGTQQGIEQQQFATQQTAVPEQLAQAQQQYSTALQGQEGAAAASGATNTVGNKTAQQNLGQGLAWSQADIYRNQALAQLGQQSEQVGYGGQQEQMANQQRQLELAAKQAGIPVQQATSNLQYGLGQLGIQGESALQQALGQAASAQGQVAGDWSAVLSLVGATTGMGPSALVGGGG